MKYKIIDSIITIDNINLKINKISNIINKERTGVKFNANRSN